MTRSEKYRKAVLRDATRRITAYTEQNSSQLEQGASWFYAQDSRNRQDIENLEITLRTHDILQSAGIKTIGQLACYPPALFGRAEKEIVENLQYWRTI